MSQNEPRGVLASARLLIFGLLAVIIIPGLALVFGAISNSVQPAPARPENVLANSSNACVTCHTQTTPGIVEEFGHSTMAAANILCGDCHEVPANYPDAEEHQGTWILREPTTAKCQTCHTSEVAQFYQSRHSLPAYVAMAGTSSLSADMLAMYQAIPEGGYSPDKSRNALFALEGHDVTRFACENCHNVGLPASDGSVGQCRKCHLRHEFSLEQVRKPETCNNCHIGPDHPQWEIYQESAHGIAYATGGDNWNWDADPGTLTVSDFPAPTCAICHMSGFGASGTTHDVGDRLTWYLFAPKSERRPAWQDNMVRMQTVCSECHNQNFIQTFYADGDRLVAAINDWVTESDNIVAPLIQAGLMTSAPFDQPIDFTYFELWHHWGRTAKFGAWMQGADYVQWHGAYEILSDLAELNQMATDMQAAGPPAPESTPEPASSGG